MGIIITVRENKKKKKQQFADVHDAVQQNEAVPQTKESESIVKITANPRQEVKHDVSFNLE